jgi:two-component system sporulation sensor kinase B
MMMRRWSRMILGIVLLVIILVSAPQYANAAQSDVVLTDWQVMWIKKGQTDATQSNLNGPWLDVDINKPVTELPVGMTGMWIKATVPSTTGWMQPGLLIERLYGHNISVYIDDGIVYSSSRDFIFDLNKLIMPIATTSSPTELYIRIETTSDRVGLISGIRIGNYDELSDRTVSRDLPDVLLGTAVAFLAIIMLICSGYLNDKQRVSWISLSFIALTTGMLIILYSPLPYIYMKEYGRYFLILFDIALFVLFPSLSYYVDQVFEGKYSFFTKFSRFQAGYSLFCFAVLIFYQVTDMRYFKMYTLFTTIIVGILILIQLLLIIILSIKNAAKGNRNSFILTIGILFLAISGTVDLLIYYLSATRYVLFLWKFGVLGMIITLVVILARRISIDYAMLVTYSRDLELYNHKVERTEKLKIISDLAASVAHEVRNPLQVTRGFLQLLSNRSDNQSQVYFGMAINELDRASSIITDFLTFAKPELEHQVVLDLDEEMRKIEVMMTPLTTMQGGALQFNIQEKLYIYGNSSKFKQAFINIIKNSIEAIQVDGLITIRAYSNGSKVVIHIKDSGEGMEGEELAKLGEPYFSTKTKGTGLGLMVTFRIIEVMAGTIEFHSIKGKGTEAIIRFPLVDQQSSLPNAIRA